MIEFKECQEPGYKPRTVVNTSADVTIAFAVDFTSAGEKLTKKSAKEQGKLYIPIHFLDAQKVLGDEFYNQNKKYYEKIVNNIVYLNKKSISINIAGHSIHTFQKFLNQDQLDIDLMICRFMRRLLKYLKEKDIEISLVRSGGQTGADQSAGYFAHLNHLSCLIYAPKNWAFRNEFGQDIYDENLFKERFKY